MFIAAGIGLCRIAGKTFPEVFQVLGLVLDQRNAGNCSAASLGRYAGRMTWRMPWVNSYNDQLCPCLGTIMVCENRLRLAFPPEALSSLQSHPLIVQGSLSQGASKDWLVTCFDTPNLMLRDAGVILSTCKTGKARRQTVGYTVESIDGGRLRQKWERRFGGRFDFSAIDVPEVRALLEAQAEQLAPCFIAEFCRKTHIVEPEPGVSIQVSIDTGKLVAEANELPINEIKLELQHGSVTDLLNLAIALCGHFPLFPFDQSKVERGYRLLCADAGKPAKAGKSTVIPTSTPLQAFRALATQAQECWQSNLHGALVSPDPEYVHQFRVTLRRLRTLLKVYKSTLPRGFAQSWSDTLGKLAAGTGDARDLDVLRETILQPVLDSEDGPALESLMQRAMDACLKAREAAHSSLSASVHAVPLLTFARALNTLPENEDSGELAGFVRKRLNRVHSRACKRLAVATEARTPETAHQLRIALKHLRYSCEFFAPVFDEASMLRFAKDIAVLQDELGFLNDLKVAWGFLGEWAQGEPALLDARARVTKWHAGRTDKIRATLFSRAKKLLATRAPWESTRRQRSNDRRQGARDRRKVPRT